MSFRGADSPLFGQFPGFIPPSPSVFKVRLRRSKEVKNLKLVDGFLHWFSTM